MRLCVYMGRFYLLTEGGLGRILLHLGWPDGGVVAGASMESQPAMPWIHQWLASIDAVLVIYASKFEDLGYDSRNILSQMTTEELKSDLEGMSVKHAHGRMILKHHAKLQEATTSDAETASPVQAQASSSGAVEGIAQRLPPFVADAIDFQNLGVRVCISLHVRPALAGSRCRETISCEDQLRRDFPVPRELGSRPKVFIPVLCLRWAQGKIHGQMVFTSGAFKDMGGSAVLCPAPIIKS